MNTYVMQRLVSSRQADLRLDREGTVSGRRSLLQFLRSSR